MTDTGLSHAIWRAKIASKTKPIRWTPAKSVVVKSHDILPDAVRTALENLYKIIDPDPADPPKHYPKILHIKHVVADFYSIERLDLDCDRRDKPVIRARHVAMYLARALTLHSLPEIGRRFGGRDHTTVLHAVRKVMDKMELHPDFANEIQELKELINAQQPTSDPTR